MKHPLDITEPKRSADKAAQCDGKDPLTFAQAQEIARRMTRKGRVVFAYRCWVCGQYHVGQSSSFKRRK